MKSMCQEARRNSPSVADCRPASSWLRPGRLAVGRTDTEKGPGERVAFAVHLGQYGGEVHVAQHRRTLAGAQ